jgi:N-acyl-D-amino-acid deacylase
MNLYKKITFILLLILVLINVSSTQEIIYDIFIIDALIYDGMKSTPYLANIGIDGDKIEYIGEGLYDSKELIDAKGYILSPGFIDMQTHSDNVMMDKKLSYEAYLRQGITTIVTGNCGQSPLHFDYFIKVVKPAVNYVVFSGYNMLKIKMQKNPAEMASNKELKLMSEKLREEMVLGSKGLSLGLAYYPAFELDDSIEEILYLLDSVKDLNPIIKVHIRCESDSIEDSIVEVMEIAKETNSRLMISHVKIMGKENEGLSSKIISLIEYYQDLGVEISCDTYPYLASSSYLAMLIPDYYNVISKNGYDFNKLSVDEILERINIRGGPGNIYITKCKNKIYEKKSLKEISDMIELSIYDTVKELLNEDKKTIAIFFMINESDMYRFLGLDYVNVGSDSTLGLFNHPRATGSFPYYLSYIYHNNNEYNYAFGEDLIKLTSKPAEYLGLSKRGKILPGYYADLIIFDKTGFKQMSDYYNAKDYSIGIKYVIVNGKIIIYKGNLKNIKNGELLK